MLSRFPDGHHVPRNRQSALAQAGGPSPIGSRVTGGLSAHTGTPRIATHTGRPGPQPHSARQAIAVSQRNAITQRAVGQVTGKVKDLVQGPRLPYAAYRPGAAGRTSWTKTVDINGQTWYRTQVQELWVFSHQIDHYGSLEFSVYNPRTKTYATFTPTGYISGKESFNGIASATGEFGRVYANFLAGTVATFATFGVAAEFEAGTAVLAGTRGLLIRGGQLVSSQATRLGAQIVEEFTIKKFLAKAMIDGSVQFGSGLLTKGSVRESLGDLNLVSLLVAGVMPGEGWGAAFRNSTLTSTFKVGVKAEKNQVQPYLELPTLTSVEGVGKYLLNISFGAVGDKAKGKLSEEVAPLFRLATRVMSQSEYVALHWISAQRVMLGTVLGTVGGGTFFDATKDKLKEEVQSHLPGAAKEKPKKE